MIRILHLEDSVADHRLVCARLRAEQLECAVTRVEAEAPFRAALAADCPDLILADYRLPAFDGRAALRIAQHHCPEVPFIVVSGAIGETGAVEILRAGATDYVLKEHDERLVPAIRRALAEAESRRARDAAEQALAESAALLADFFDNATIGLHWCGPDGTVLRANRAELDLLGYTQEEYVGRPLADFHVDRAVIDDIFSRLKNGEAVPEREARLRCKDGSIRHVAITASVLRDAAGRFVHSRGFTRDITETKKAQEDLRARAEENDALLDALPAFVWTCRDQECRVITGNRAANELTGVSAGTNISQTAAASGEALYLRQLKEDGTEYRPEELPMQRSLASGQTVRDAQLDFRFPDGRAVQALGSVVPLLDAQGRPRGAIGAFVDITQRKQAENALRRSEQRHRLMAETMLQGVVHQAADGSIIGMNPAAERILGKTREQFLGSNSEREETHTVRADGSPFPGAEHPSMLALKTGEPVRGVLMGVFNPQRKEYRWISIDAVPVVVPGQPQPSEVYAIFEDITERKRAEQALWEAHDRLQTVMSSITDGLAVLDKNWRYTYFSEQAAQIIGLRPEQLLGRTVWEFFPEAEKTKFGEAYRRAMATGEPVEFEEFYPAPVDKWLECRCYPSAEGLSVYFHDITARKQAEGVRRQNEALFSTLIEQAPGGVYVVDDNFRLMQINALARPAFAAAEPLQGRDLGDLMRIQWGPELGPQLTEIFRRTLVTGERYVSPRFTAERADLRAERSYDWEVQRLLLPNGRHGVVCYFSDVTAGVQAEAALRQAKEAAEAANRSKDRFLAALSHELRTPLTPVLMTVAALEHDPGLRADVRDDLGMIKRNVELETKLIDDLLDVSRITSGKVALRLEPVDLNEAVVQACGICGPQLRDQGVRLELAPGSGAFTVTVDAARFQQVLWNVLKNAVKFTPKEGTVRVSTALLDDGRCEVRVSDTGIGIAPEVLPKIFDAFEQGDPNVTRQFGGLGLGLAISKALVELHGGTIRAESAGRGRGATFVVELPGHSGIAATPAPRSAAPERGAEKAGALHLLVVEDHANTARALRLLLTGAGYTVRHAPDVAAALDLARREAFDLFVTDIGLPDGTGYDVMAGIKQIRPLPGIVISGYGMDEDVDRSREAGFAEHVVKPFAGPELLAAIARATGAGR